MTTEQWIAQEDKRIGNFVTCVGTVITTVHSLQSQRIFGEGLNGLGSSIGQYDTTAELYVNPKNAPKSFPTKGKTGQSTFKNGNPHKTGFFDSYKAFRSNQGRGTNTVDLNLSGQLFKDYSTPPVKQGNKYLVGVRNKANAGKIDGAVDKYGKIIFALTESESKILRSAKC